ncbi:MAG: PD-(D/E)XK nuclease family transposase [Clostridiales bacterium]|nr:PD-(D/E)XK nuclease family transposase [Clostridiales bacterium]
MTTEDTSESEGKVFFDILFYVYIPVSKERVKLIINIEAQNRFNPGYSLLKRVIYYCSRLMSSQYNREFDDRNYNDVKKVISVWICMNPPKDKKNTITRFSMTEKNLVGNAKYSYNEYDLIEVVMVCLGGKEDDENYSGLIKLLSTLTSPKLKPNEVKHILSNEFSIKLTKKIESEVLGMCNISYGIYEQGMTEGEIKGREKTLIENIKVLMKNLGLSFEEALRALSIPEAEYGKYRKIILG